MNTLFIIAVLIIAAIIPIVVILALYSYSQKDIFFTQVPQGEIIVVMYGKKAHRFLANITHHWIDSKTGEIWRTKIMDDGFDNILPDGKQGERKKDVPKHHPKSFYGITYMGLWPFATRYKYKLSWNKWAKKGGETEFSIQPRDEVVDSLYWESNYAFKIAGAETKERIPVDATVVLTIRVVNANIALFGVKNGWLASLDGKVLAACRDFIGSSTIEDLTTLQHEEGDTSKKAETLLKKSFIGKMMFLNYDPEEKPDVKSEPKGNESIRKTLGVEVVTAHFVDFEISAGSVKQKIEEATLKEYDMDQHVSAMNKETGAIKKREIEIGTAKAKAAQLLVTALGGPENATKVMIAKAEQDAAVAMATAIQEQKGAKQLILGSSVIPSVNQGDEK